MEYLFLFFLFIAILSLSLVIIKVFFDLLDKGIDSFINFWTSDE